MAPFPAFKKALWSVVGFSAASTALVGFAHTQTGRPLLALMAGGKKPAIEQTERQGSACPLGFSKVDPSQKDATLKQRADKLRGAQPALAKPALGFSLEKSTKADVEAWGKTNQLVCQDAKSATADLVCLDVPGGLLSREGARPAAKTVEFTFDSKDRLVALTALRYDRDPNALVPFYTGAINALSQAAGPPAKNWGASDGEYLLANHSGRVSAVFTFSDYFAKVAVTKVSSGEYMFIEEYRSLPN